MNALLHVWVGCLDFGSCEIYDRPSMTLTPLARSNRGSRES